MVIYEPTINNKSTKNILDFPELIKFANKNFNKRDSLDINKKEYVRK